MKIKLLICVAILVFVVSLPTTVSAQNVPFTCASGLALTNAIEVVVNLRPGTYTATVLGIDGFNPVLAVATYSVKTELACEDDSPEAAAYTVNLPSTGEVAASDHNAQAKFNVRGSNFTDISLVVAGADNSSGSFVLLFSSLQSAHSDFTGDPFVIPVTDILTSSSTPITAYMIGLDDALDPLIQVGTRTHKPVMVDGQPVACDDPATLVCYGGGTNLKDSALNLDTTIQPDELDAMLTLPWDVVNRVKSAGGNLFLLMSSYDQQSEGKYMVALHMGIGRAS